jgi:DNA polymerase III delta subunit
MSDEFYHKNIFGEVVDLDLVETEDGEEKIKAKYSDFNIFALTDAVGARDKKNSWVLYQKALASGMAAEEIFWKIVWIVKSMMIASKTKDYSETDMKEFPYKKAKGYAKNFSKVELENLSETLVVGYHNARRGIGEVDLVIERILLGL